MKKPRKCSEGSDLILTVTISPKWGRCLLDFPQFGENSLVSSQRGEVSLKLLVNGCQNSRLEFQHTARSYEDMRDDPEFSDVTLVFEERQFETHKIMLTNINTLFFINVLKSTTHVPLNLFERDKVL